QGPPRCPGTRRRPVSRPLRVPLARPVRPRPRSRHGPRLPRRDPPRRTGQDRPLLFHVRAEVLLDEHHPPRPRGGGAPAPPRLNATGAERRTARRSVDYRGPAAGCSSSSNAPRCCTVSMNSSTISSTTRLVGLTVVRLPTT